MNPSLLWLTAALFTWGVGESMFFYFQPLYLQQLGADPLMIGGILSVAGIAMTVAHIPAGYLADRVGRRPLLIAAFMIGSVAAGLMGLASNLGSFVVGLLFYSLTAFVSSPLNSYATAARGKWSVARAITIVSASFNLGMIIGPLTGGWLGDHFGIRIIYLVAAGLFILSTVLVTRIQAQPRDVQSADAPPPGLLKNRRYLGFLGLAFGVAFATYLAQPLTPNFLQNERGLSLSQIGLLGALGGIGNVTLSLQLGQLKARSGYLLAQVCVLLFSLLIWQGSGMAFYGLAYFLLGGFRAGRSLAVAQIRPLIHESQMGLAYGMADTALNSTMVMAPLLAGFLYQTRPEMVYPLAMAVLLIVILASFIFAPREEVSNMPLEQT
ncbi:MAG: MFS transporter [Anaerolineales bacterium]|jgi:MFS family permease|nr:MFS transporter [Anaerolineales bacterium]